MSTSERPLPAHYADLFEYGRTSDGRLVLGMALYWRDLYLFALTPNDDTPERRLERIVCEAFDLFPSVGHVPLLASYALGAFPWNDDERLFQVTVIAQVPIADPKIATPVDDSPEYVARITGMALDRARATRGRLHAKGFV